MALLYNKCYLNSNDLGVIFSECGLSGNLFFEFINFRPGRDFINGRGLLIQGGDYLIRYYYAAILLFNPILLCCNTTMLKHNGNDTTTTTTTTATTTTNNSRGRTGDEDGLGLPLGKQESLQHIVFSLFLK